MGEGATMKAEHFAKLQLSVGYGENHFTMNHGSFSYHRKISRMTPCELVMMTPGRDGFTLKFKDPSAEKRNRKKIRSKKEEGAREAESGIYEIAVTEKNGRVTVEMKSVVPSEINLFDVTFPCRPDEHFYGCGETYSKFDLKGENVRIWVAEHQNSKRIGGKILREKLTGRHPKHVLPFRKYESYYAQPTFVSSAKYFIHVDTNAYSEFDFTADRSITLHLQEPPKFFAQDGKTFSELSEKQSALLGRLPALPDWTFDGAILAVQRGTAVVDEKIKKAQDAGIRLCGIWSQDWCGCRETGFGYQVMWNWKYDETLYPDLPEKIQEWKEKGAAFLGYINPFLAIEKPLYREASEKGYCVRDAHGNDYLVKITTFPAAMIDFTNPSAYEWYKNLIKENMIGIGMGGWMADFGEYLPTDCVLFSGEDPAVIHNQWPAIWARMNREAIEETGKLGEVFFFTRAGHTGTIANSTMMWTGDQHVDWSLDDGLIATVPASLSLAMSGYPAAHSDAGGYTTIMHMTRTKELLMRWEEMNAFTPLLRTHEGNQPSRDVQFDDDEELLRQMSVSSRRHAALKPYLESVEKEMTEKGTPVMRPLFYHYDEPEAYTEKTEYLLGRDLLVAPVYLPKQTGRSVFFPNDTWVHLFDGEIYHGGTCRVEAPIGQPAVFVRRDSPFFEQLRKEVGQLR